MKTSAPQIGFDRFIQLDWAATALRVRAGTVGLVDLNALLDIAELGVEARKKTRTVLNRLWLEPRTELVDFVDRAVSLYKNQPDTPIHDDAVLDLRDLEKPEPGPTFKRTEQSASRLALRHLKISTNHW